MDAPPALAKPPPVHHWGLGVLVAALAVLLVVALGVLLFVALRPGGRGGHGSGGNGANCPNGPSGLKKGLLSPLPTPPNAFEPHDPAKGQCNNYIDKVAKLGEAYWSFLFIKVFQQGPSGCYTTVYDGSGDKIRPAKSGFFRWETQVPNNSRGVFGPQDDLCSFDGTYTKIAGGADPVRGIKLVSTKVFNSGLFIMAANHIPSGYGVWPAFWLTAAEKPPASWACNGEIDILEYTNDAGQDGKGVSVSTLHTNTKPGGQPCDQSGVPGISNDGKCTAGDGGAGHTAGCNSNELGPNLGCGTAMPGGKGSAGAAFNDAGGGTIACEWTPGGKITIWFWSASDGIPSDILANRPNPASWTTPRKIALKPCPGQFANMNLVIDTKYCGDWSGNSWPN